MRLPSLSSLLMGLVLAGCNRPAPPEAQDGIDLQPIDRAGFDQLLQQHRGKVVLVDFWATWCGPCRESFPHTVALHRRWADRGLVVVTISLDQPEKEAQVRQFLASQGGAALNFQAREGSSSQSFTAYGIKIGIPDVQIYDRQGNMHEFVGSDKETEEEIDRAIETLLKGT